MKNHGSNSTTHPCILLQPSPDVAVALRGGLLLRPVSVWHRTTRQARVPVDGGRIPRPGPRALLGRPPVAVLLLLVLPDSDEVDLALLDGRLGRAARLAVLALEYIRQRRVTCQITKGEGRREKLNETATAAAKSSHE